MNLFDLTKESDFGRGHKRETVKSSIGVFSDKKSYMKEYRKIYFQRTGLTNYQIYSKTPKGSYNFYCHGSKRRGIEFGITFEKFLTFWQKPCNYCGVEILTIGLDRVDSSKGYIIDNIVSCCKTCNFAKSDLSESEFMEYLMRVHSFIEKRLKEK